MEALPLALSPHIQRKKWLPHLQESSHVSVHLPQAVCGTLGSYSNCNSKFVCMYRRERRGRERGEGGVRRKGPGKGRREGERERERER